MAGRFHALLRLLLRRNEPADGAVPDGRQVGTDHPAAAGGDDANLAAGGFDVDAGRDSGASFGKLYIWARYDNWAPALKQGLITIDQAHAIHWKQPMLNVTSFYVVSLVCFAIFALYITLLNRWSVKRDADLSRTWRTGV